MKKSIAALLALAGLVGGSASAATITSVGTEFTVGGIFAPANLSNPSTPKTCDIGGTERYGTAGYPDNLPNFRAGDVYQAAGNGNDLGVTGLPPLATSMVSQPTYVSALSGYAGAARMRQFERAGEYVKDYFVIKEGDTFHLFYNVGDAGSTQDWQEPRNEKAFGHATSTNLVNWQYHPRVLPVVPGTWEGQVVSAPSVLKHNGQYYMVYSGFDDRQVGKQSIGLATSTNLFDWERSPANPVYTAPPWTILHPNGWVDCRDAHIIRYGDEFLLFTMVTTKEGKGAISLASSPDAVKWQDLGPAVITFSQPESPRVFKHQGTYYMFASSSNGKKLFKTLDPKSTTWVEVPFEWPAPGLWSGWEVVEDNGRLIFSAFEWKMSGNYIRFWDVAWDGDVPRVIYQKAAAY